MHQQQIFLIGSIVFFVYLFFYLRIVIRQLGKMKMMKTITMTQTILMGWAIRAGYQIKNLKTERYKPNKESISQTV